MLLAPGHTAVAHEEHQKPEHRQCAPLPRRRQAVAAKHGQPSQEEPGGDVPQTAHEKRRDGRERDLDRNVGRAPDDADRPPRDPGEAWARHWGAHSGALRLQERSLQVPVVRRESAFRIVVGKVPPHLVHLGVEVIRGGQNERFDRYRDHRRSKLLGAVM